MSNLKKLAYKYFISDDLPLESRILNFVCFTGAIAAVFAIISRFIAGLPFITMVPIMLFLVTIICMLFMSIKQAKYAEVLMIIILFGLSILFWPALFFTIGGPDSGMIAYFTLAIILDFTLLKGKTRVIALIVTVLVAVFCFVSTLFFGFGVLPKGGLNTYQLFVDIMQSIFIVGALTGSIVLYQIKLYQTEKTKAQTAVNALKTAQLTVTTMFESNPHMNVLFDSGFKVIDCNPSAYKFMGFTSKEELFEKFIERINASIPEFQSSGRKSIPLPERLAAAARDGYSNFETELNINGVKKILSVEMRMIPYGDSFALVSYIMDLTDTRAWERELMYRDKLLNEAIEEVRAANHAKTVFLANVSHEIRTPMNSIMGFAELALENAVSPQARDYLNKITDSTKWLLRIINDILDISKIESGKIELEKVPFDLSGIFMRCQSVILPGVNEKGLDLRVYAEPVAGRKLVGDPVRLYQALMNLLSNAIKFTNEGVVKMSSSIKSMDENSATIYFEVNDSGIGLSPGQTEKIFEPFIQADSSTTRNYGGTGLGLAIAKNIVELMGGELMVESAPGAGSTFYFELTFETIAASDDKPEFEDIVILKKPHFDGVVLICEDNPMNQQLICDHLARVGLKTEVAGNGKIGLDIIQKRMNAGEKPFDMIFMDMFMPVMDGLEAASRITALGFKAPIIAMTANIMTGELESYKKCGMSECIDKPFTTQELWRCLLKYLTPVGAHDIDEDAQIRDNDLLQQRLKINFVKNNQSKILELNKATSSGDLELAHRIAHTLKTNAGLIGKPGLQSAAAKIEAKLKEGIIPFTKQLDSLEVELNAVLEELKPLLDEQAAQSEKDYLNYMQILELIGKLEPMIENINPECMELIGNIRAIPGAGALADAIEIFDFEAAGKELAKLKSEWV